MNTEWLLPLLSFAIISCMTPGPNNVLLTQSGARFGVRRSVPHVFGITAGLGVLLLIMATGLNALFYGWPALQWVLKLLGSAYLLWLGWKIASAPPLVLNSGDASSAERPWGPFQAIAFQFCNPKAWLMAISAVGSFSLVGKAYWPSVGGMVVIYSLVCALSCLIWARFGAEVGRWLSTPRAWCLFNRWMGIATAACVLLLWH